MNKVLSFRQALLVVLGLLFAGTAHAQVSGISYTFTPLAERISFDGNAGLKDDFLYGGKLGFGFGEFFELGGVFLFNEKLETDFGGFDEVDEITQNLLGGLTSREVKFRRYGGDLKLNIGRGSVFPYVSVGTGLIRFEPDGLASSETIYISGALGVQIQLQDRYTLIVQANSLAYRYNPASTLLSESDLTDVGLEAAELGQVNVNNLGLSAGLSFYLGGRSQGELSEIDRAFQQQLESGLRGIRLQIEPMAAVIDFKESTGLRADQRIVGGSVGIDVGPYLGLRGFYWRGVTDDSWTDFEELQAYGGEMKLSFSTLSRGLTPYITLGGGLLDVGGAYMGNTVQTPEDRPFAMGGGGVRFPISQAIQLHGGARALLTTTDDLENAGSPSTVETSFMYGGGITFSLGGSSGANAVADASGRAVSAERQRGMDERTRIEVELARAQARIDSLEMAIAARPAQTAAAATPAPANTNVATPAASDTPASSDTTTTAQPRATAQTTPASQSDGTTMPRERWVTVPVPEEGELYLRYGSPGGVTVETISGDAVVIDPVTGQMTTVAPATAGAPATRVVTDSTGTAAALSAEQLQQIIRAAVRRELDARPDGAQPSANDVSEMEDRLEERLVAMERRLVEARANGQRQIVVPSGGSQTTIIEQESTVGTRFSGIYPLTGFSLNEPLQGLFGVRAEFRQGGRSYRFLPEVLLGFGEGSLTTAINANVAIGVGTNLFEGFEPYVGGGLGFLNVNGLELVLNLNVGVERPFNFGRMFLEFGTQDFLDNNRLLLGYRIGF